MTCAFLKQKNKLKSSDFNTFKPKIKDKILHKGFIVNQALSSLHGGSLEVNITVPLSYVYLLIPLSDLAELGGTLLLSSYNIFNK